MTFPFTARSPLAQSGYVGSLGISVVERLYGGILVVSPWGYFGGFTTKIPPYLPLTPAIPREPVCFKLGVSF